MRVAKIIFINITLTHLDTFYILKQLAAANPWNRFVRLCLLPTKKGIQCILIRG